MTSQEISKLKSQIFVYHIIPFDSLGIYLADSKEDAIRSISKDLWDDVEWNKLQNPSFEDRKEIMDDMELPEILRDKILEQSHKPINIFKAVEIWTWDEYQKSQGFKVSDRLLEICN